MVEAAIRASATALVAALRKHGLTLAAAESCTGGWFAKSVVDVPGASEVFLGGVVSYVNRIKEQVLGVPRALLDQYTAVSAPVAEAMAIGAQKLTGADIAVSVTGLAGPGGGTAEIPVGRVYIGLCDKGGSTVIPLDLSGTRDEVRAQAVLRMIKEITKRYI